MLRRFAPRNDGAPSRYDSAIPRRDAPESCWKLHARKIRGRRECRMRAAPAVSCAKLCKERAHEHTGSAEAIRHSLRNGFTAYAALSPVTSSLLSPSSANWRLCDTRSGSQNLRRFSISNGCQDHTVLPYPSAPFVCALPGRSQVFRQPALRSRPRARRCRVHRIPAQRS